MYMLFQWEVRETKKNIGSSQLWENVSKYLLLYVKCFRRFQGKISYFIRRFNLFSQNLVTHKPKVTLCVCILYMYILCIHTCSRIPQYDKMFIHTMCNLYTYTLHTGTHYTYIGAIKSICSHLYMCTQTWATYQFIYQGLSLVLFLTLKKVTKFIYALCKNSNITEVHRVEVKLCSHPALDL